MIYSLEKGRGLGFDSQKTRLIQVRFASLQVSCCCFYAAPGPPSWSVPSGPPSGPFGPSGSPAGSGVVDSSSAAWSTEPLLLLFELTLWVRTRPPASISAAIANNVR